jgi:DNA-binding MarR family transcriptional regulator
MDIEITLTGDGRIILERCKEKDKQAVLSILEELISEKDLDSVNKFLSEAGDSELVFGEEFFCG